MVPAIFRVDWRFVLNDAVVTPWKDTELPWSNSAASAYARLSEWLGCVPDRVGFTESPELGDIRTGERYGEYSLFQHPQSDKHQYRIVKAGLLGALEDHMLDTAAQLKIAASPKPLPAAPLKPIEPEPERQIIL